MQDINKLSKSKEIEKMETSLSQIISMLLMDYETLASHYNALYTILEKKGLVSNTEMTSMIARLRQEAK